MSSTDLFRMGKVRDGKGRSPGNWQDGLGILSLGKNGGQIWGHSLLPVSGHLATFTQLDFRIFKVQRVLFASYPCLLNDSSV